MTPLLIAHRAGPTRFPEQTLESARYALSCGADMVEMDVRLTKDGQPVICHDKSAERIFGVRRNVEDMTFEEFMRLRHAKNPTFKAHSLEEALRSGVAPLLLHQKISGAPLEIVLERILASGAADRVILGVRTPQDFALIHAAAPPIQVLAFMPTENDLAGFLKTDVPYIRLWESWVTEEKLRHIHSAGRRVWIMTGETHGYEVGYTCEESLLAFQRMGVDGILVNDVPWAKRVLGAADAARDFDIF